jgi:hypothetical protein
MARRVSRFVAWVAGGANMADAAAVARLPGDVVIARRKVVEDHLDHIADPTGLLMIYVGDILGDCRLLDWRQPS